MDLSRIPELKIGDLIAKVPIVQGGMGVGISMSGLASAVANAGGIGVISSVGLGMLEKDWGSNFREANLRAFRNEIRKARELTDGIVGVNIMMALSDFDELLNIAFEEMIDVIFVGAGLLVKLPKEINKEFLEKTKTKIVPIVSSDRATNVIFKNWTKKYDYIPDAVVVEGPLAGGHLGFKKTEIEDSDFSLENLVPKVKDILKSFENKFNKEIPVIAAGGIFSGLDIKKFIDLGAQAVQMATRFVATDECDASDTFKNAYLNCKKEDIQIIQSPVGLPGRAIANEYLSKVSDGLKKPVVCPWKCLKTCDFQKVPYCIGAALTSAKKGNLNSGFAFAGANAYLIDKIVSVKELFNELVDEFNASF